MHFNSDRRTLGAFQRDVCDWLTLKQKSQALYKKIENRNVYGRHHYTKSRSERAEKSKKITIRNLTLPSGQEIGSATCVTAHGQEFSITLTYGDISAKYGYNGKNTYHHGVSDITGKMYDTIHVT